ncbi:MAG: tRNA (adenosine(37)-N6)-threonylcarbamoyltransferase complex dimerization subunit type 1 TsaB [Deltaproteobacteria bacterium]|nr:tRNA (adenosine(37)-N6)-threonylcarbamoyltransferase complex dimerization subunit type 1 TsaB [Deltaproteobacteria bacterium]
MKILALDTSTQIGSLALLDKGQVLAQADLPRGETHSITLLPALRDMLALRNLSVHDLDLVAVGLGPGSFTGLRIGLSTAKGLAWAAGKPLVGVSTLDALAWAMPPGHNSICPVIDGRRRQVFAVFFQWMADSADGGAYVAVTEPSAYTKDQLLAFVKRETVFIGDGLVRWGADLAESLGPLYIRGPERLDYPSAVAVGMVALKLHRQGAETRPAHISPCYIRPPDIREIKAGKVLIP